MVWPFHLLHEFSEIFPFKTHYRTLSGRQLRIDININASWGWAGCGKCDVSWRRFVDTGNSISRKVFFTGAAKSSVIICTVSILMTIVIASCAFINIFTLIIKHREACLADTLAIRTRRASWAANFTRVLFTAEKSISKEIISTNANFVIVTVSIRIALQARVLIIKLLIIFYKMYLTSLDISDVDIVKYRKIFLILKIKKELVRGIRTHDLTRITPKSYPVHHKRLDYWMHGVFIILS